LGNYVFKIIVSFFWRIVRTICLCLHAHRLNLLGSARATESPFRKSTRWWARPSIYVLLSFSIFIVPSLTFCSVVLLSCSSITDASRDLRLPRRPRATVAPACSMVSSAAPRYSSSSRSPSLYKVFVARAPRVCWNFFGLIESSQADAVARATE
jgi:hypothetical protein